LSEFFFYYPLGITHILSWAGYDHMLFILVLCSSFSLKEWRRILGVVTAFTLGHSITLALSVLNWIHLPGPWVEFLIPITIAITALQNLIPRRSNNGSNSNAFTMALFFGFIHGMGFASGLRSLLGKEASIFMPLLGFNLGLETGQLVVVSLFFFLSSLLIRIPNFSQKLLNQVLSILVFLIALFLAYIRFPSTNILYSS